MYHQASEATPKPSSPISLYNLIIKQYNDPINIQNQVPLKKAYQNSLYKFWYNIQTSYRFILLIFYFFPYLNFISLFLNLYLVIINELAIIRFNRNRSKVPDPLSSMIYEPGLCSSSRYMYYEVDKSELKVFNLPKQTISKILNLKENSEGKLARFMVYNRDFIAGYYSAVEYRLASYMHLVISAVILVIVYYFLYSHNSCFSLLSPMDSYRRCRVLKSKIH